MDIQEITKFALNNIIPILAGLGVIAVILLALLINLYMKVSYMKKRYRKMMTGADGANLERMLIGHLNEIQEVSEENAAIKRENERLDGLLQLAITRVGVVQARPDGRNAC